MEEWKDIKGYENYYQISNYGRVRSLDRYVTRHSKFGTPFKMFIKGQIIKPIIKKYGYANVELTKGNKTSLSIAWLVYSHFGDKDISELNRKKLYIDHIDGDNKNNHIDNLKLLTKTEVYEKHKMYNVNPKYPVGVSKHSENKYLAHIRYYQKVRHLGYYKTTEEASSVYNEMSNLYKSGATEEILEEKRKKLLEKNKNK